MAGDKETGSPGRGEGAACFLLFYRKCHFIYDRKYLFHNISIDCFGTFSEVYNKK